LGKKKKLISHRVKPSFSIHSFIQLLCLTGLVACLVSISLILVIWFEMLENKKKKKKRKNKKKRKKD
jgi:hypothetical protein